MIPVLDEKAYLKALMNTSRPGEGQVLAYYEHRLGALVTEPRLLLAPLDDHLFHRGDGVFEVLKYVDRHIYQLEEHMARMRKSAASIRLTPPCPWEELRALVLRLTAQVADSSGQSHGIIRIFLGRGPGGFGVDPAECPASSLYIVLSRFSPKPDSWYAKGLSGFRSAVPARPEYLAQIKNTNYLTAVLMTMEAHDKGCDIPFCFDAEGCLAESAVANICLVDREKRLIVPEFKHALPGTTIRRAMELLAASPEDKIECVIRRVPEAEIYTSTEVLLLGTSPDCAPIVSYEGRKIGDGTPGPMSELLRGLIRRDIQNNGTAF